MPALFERLPLHVDLPVEATAEITSRGQYVEGSVALTGQTNPANRRRLAIKYRRPASWTPEQEKSILRLAVLWFAKIGKMRLLDAAVGKHIHARLAAGYSEAAIAAAIGAYAASDWHRNYRQWTTLDRFLMTQRLDEWIEKSPEYAAQVEQQRRADSTAAVDLALQRMGYQRQETLQAAVLESQRVCREIEALGHPLTAQMRDKIFTGVLRDAQVLSSQRQLDASKAAAQRKIDDAERTWQSLPVAAQQGILARVDAEARRYGWEDPHDMTNFRFKIAVLTYAQTAAKHRSPQPA